MCATPLISEREGFDVAFIGADIAGCVGGGLVGRAEVYGLSVAGRATLETPNHGNRE